jgi:hypothetical protein
MGTELVHVGFGNIIAANKIIALLAPDHQPTKRLIKEAKSRGLLIDTTHGRKSKAAILLDTGHVVLAAISPETVAHRLSTICEPGEEKIEA